MSNLNWADDQVLNFNHLAGAFQTTDHKAGIDLQLSLVFEELQETITAFEEENEVELLDGAVDCLVTVLGLLQKLEYAGFNVAEATKRVCDNNMSKFPVQKPDEKMLMPGHSLEYNANYKRWVVKDRNGKVRKPPFYMPVDLTMLVPNNLFTKGKNNT